MGRSGDDKIILSYNDAVLRESDLDILSGPFFLNDRIVEFYFNYLSSIHPSKEILLVSPSIAFWLSNCPDTVSLKDFVQPLGLQDKKLVIFTVNNNNDVNLAEGGSHWSLLAYDRDANVFVHHDSCLGMNKRHALQLYKSVMDYMGSTIRAEFVEFKDSPQQENGYDCGLYVLAIARGICGWSESCEKGKRDGKWFSDVKGRVTPGAVALMRNEILSLVTSLMDKNQASPSKKTNT